MSIYEHNDRLFNAKREPVIFLRNDDLSVKSQLATIRIELGDYILYNRETGNNILSF